MQLQVFIGPINFKDNLRTIEARFPKNLRTTEAHFELTDPYILIREYDLVCGVPLYQKDFLLFFTFNDQVL